MDYDEARNRYAVIIKNSALAEAAAKASGQALPAANGNGGACAHMKRHVFAPIKNSVLAEAAAKASGQALPANGNGGARACTHARTCL